MIHQGSGGVVGTKRSSKWQFLEIGSEVKEDGKKIVTVRCKIEIEGKGQCTWTRKLVNGETGAMGKHFKSVGQNCPNHRAAAALCDESSCNKVKTLVCAVRSLPLHVIAFKRAAPFINSEANFERTFSAASGQSPTELT